MHEPDRDVEAPTLAAGELEQRALLQAGEVEPRSDRGEPRVRVGLRQPPEPRLGDELLADARARRRRRADLRDAGSSPRPATGRRGRALDPAGGARELADRPVRREEQAEGGGARAWRDRTLTAVTRPAPAPAAAPPTLAPDRPGAAPVAVAAVVWSLAFAAIHVAWALGSDVGLGGRAVTGVLLVIDVVAIPLCLLAAWVAWRLSDARRAASAPPIVRRMAVAAAVVLTLRGLGTIQAAVAPPDDATLLTRLVDPYFLLGGVLFALVARRARPRTTGIG